MKRSLQSRLLRTTIAGIVAFSPAYALAGEAQYYFPKDDATKSSDKPASGDAAKDKNGKTDNQKARNQLAGRNKAGSVAPISTNRSGFRPDFDGTGGRGPAVAPEEGKKNPDDEGYYVKTRGYRLEPEPDIPPYVRNLAKTYSEFKDIDWLNVGLDTRTRYEYRENSYVPRVNTTGIGDAAQRQYYPYTPWLLRTRGYVGVKDIFDPFRFVIEFQDSRAFNSLYQLQGQDINETELLQGYGELYLKDALGTDAKGQGRAISIRAGRMKFEVGSRRLIASNEFRNTTNNFEGFRLRLGERYNDVDLDSFLMRPVIRYPYAFDQPEWNNWIYGSFLSIRNISPYFTIQPYLIGRHQYGDPLNPSGALKVKRDTQGPGLRVYGNYKNFDWDLDVMKQFGTVGTISSTYPYLYGYTNITNPYGGYAQTKQHDAIAYGFDVGYTFAEHPWKPRFSAVYIYGSGNSSPWSSTNNNVDTFYGFNQPFSRNDYIGWNNVKDPKVRVEFEPIKDTKIDTAFSAYWLASAAAAWDRANLFAPLGNRGTFMGTEWDIRVRQRVNQFINISASYARFWPGSFPSSFAPPTAQQWPPVNFPGGTVPGQTGTTNGLTARPTNFFYLEATANAFGDGKPIAKLPGSEFIASLEPNAPQAKAPSWTDVYLGLNAGGAWSSPSITSQNIGWAGLVPTATLGKNSIGVANSTLTPLPVAFTNDISGFVGGFQIGANYKFAESFVAGVEADLDGTAGNTNSKWTLGSARGGGNNIFTTYSQHTTTLSYLGTIRGRLGYLVTPTLLAYGTGGFAYGGVTAANPNVTTRSGGTNFFYSGPQFNGTLLGWAAGGGLEWMFTKDWSVKADYLYYNLGNVSLADNFYSVTYAPFVGNTNYLNNGNAFGLTGLASANFSGNVIRAGVNRHFDLLNDDAKTAEKPVLAAAIGSTGSSAKKTLAPAKPVNWGGAYGGVNLGGIWANQNSINQITAWPFVNRPPQFVSSDAWLSGSVPASGTAALLGGGQIGYNIELDKLWRLKFVTGVEADIQGVTPAGTKGTNTFLTTLTPINGANQALVSRSAVNSLNFIGTARGRFGFTLIPSILFYGTGGVAYGATTTSLQNFSGLGSLGGWQGGSGSVSNLQVGWTAGGGAEWSFRDNWSVKGEYLFYDLGKASGSVLNYAYLPGAAPRLASQSQFTERYAGNILRAGVNYHLPIEKAEPVVAGY